MTETVEIDGALPGGKRLGVAITEVEEAIGGYPAYYMINCAHPRHFARELRSGAPWVRRIGGLRANASAKSHAELDASPDIDIGDIAELADRSRRSSAKPSVSDLPKIEREHSPGAYRFISSEETLRLGLKVVFLASWPVPGSGAIVE